MNAPPLLRKFALAAAATLAVSGCGVEQDDRPLELDYIVTTILAPSCGTAACHSSRIKTAGVAFDTVEAAREAFDSDPLVIEGDPDASGLIFLLVGATEPNKRMPKDAPLPDADIDLLRRWIAAGAEGWR